MATVNSLGTGWGVFSKMPRGGVFLYRRDMRMRENKPIGSVGIGASGQPHLDDRSLPPTGRRQRMQLCRREAARTPVQRTTVIQAATRAAGEAMAPRRYASR